MHATGATVTRRVPRPNRPDKVLIYLVRGDRLLVFQRASGKKVRATLEVPKGGLRPMETAVQAAQRECLEESGLEALSLTPLHTWQFRPEGKKRTQTWQAFWGEAPIETLDAFVHGVTGQGKDRGRHFHFQFVQIEGLVLSPGHGEALQALRQQ
ncbi:NUDIX hydrolase (plasmid) [Deinococcus radiomollis]|uniref:NUDIX domain-containing protein n=1 Tax=Deinococcus radiomollis TaxID=468916 RepID=UPI003891E7B6